MLFVKGNLKAFAQKLPLKFRRRRGEKRGNILKVQNNSDKYSLIMYPEKSPEVHSQTACFSADIQPFLVRHIMPVTWMDRVAHSFPESMPTETYH
jgi:hypothetical protein